MPTAQLAQKQFEIVLAFAHAALRDTTSQRIAQVRTYAAALVSQLAHVKSTPANMGEARQLYELATQLRGILAMLDAKTRAGK